MTKYEYNPVTAPLQRQYDTYKDIEYEGYMGCELAGSYKYSDAGVVAPNGKIYMCPQFANDFLIIDEDNLYRRSNMGLSFSTDNGWLSMCLGDDGKLYVIPFQGTTCMIIDPETETGYFENYGLSLGDAYKWTGLISGNNGKLYGIPSHSTTILVIDTINQTAIRTDMGVDLSGTSKWGGQVMGADGKIYCAPNNANDILIIDPKTDTAVRTTMGLSLSGTSKFRHGVAVGKKIYFVPTTSTSILVIDTETQTAYLTNMGVTLSTEAKFIGAALGDDGLIYASPYETNKFLVIDPKTETAFLSDLGEEGLVNNTQRSTGLVNRDGMLFATPSTYYLALVVDTIKDSIDYQKAFYNRAFHNIGGGSSSSNAKWASGILAPNGKIYCPNWNASVVLVINTKTNVSYTRQFGLGNLTLTGTEYLTGVLAPNGKIYCIPGNSSNVMVIDPSTETAYKTNMGVSLSTSVLKYYCAVLAPNGKIYCIPRDANNVMIIDPETDTAITTDFGLNLTGSRKWFDACLGLDGKIYCLPQSSPDFLVIDPINNTAIRSTLGANITDDGNVGMAMGADGKIYCPPRDASDFIIIDTVSGVAYNDNLGLNKASGDVYFNIANSANGKMMASSVGSGRYHIEIDPFSGTARKIDDIGVTESTVTFQHYGVVTDSKGWTYMVPARANHVTIFKPKSKYNIEMNKDVLLSPYYNKK